MKCQDYVEQAQTGALGVMEEHERWLALQHISSCDDCRDALRGAEVLRFLSNQPAEPVPAGARARMLDQVDRPRAQGSRRDFWRGAGAGSGLAAAIFTAIVSFGLLQPGNQQPATEVADFYVSTALPREMNIAIDAETALPGATLSLTLYGGIELAGYATQRHLSWTTDLEAGVNRLALPIIALDETGGQVIVRLDHPDSHQEFLVQVRHDI